MKALPFSRLPGMNSLFLEFMDEPETVSEFYPSPSSLRSVSLTHRKELCEILERQNHKFGNPHTANLLEKLAHPETGCVITGQQVGLLTGPMYTLWKAFTAIHESREFEAIGNSCIPIFWMASEDHNIHEISNFALLKPDFQLSAFSLKEHFFLKRQPTGSIPCTEPEIRKILMRAFSMIPDPAIKEFYSTGTLAEAFARTLLWTLKDFPILIVDPSDPELKRLAKPFFESFFVKSGHLLSVLSQQNETLRSRNYPVQVNMEDENLPLFSIDENGRSHVRREQSPGSIPVEKLSPSALLRPLFQDFLFPTLAYVGGPAEIAYFAQIHPWYKEMKIEQPRLLSRVSLTLIPDAIRKFLESRRLSPEELYLNEDVLLDVLLDSELMGRSKKTLRDLQTAVTTSLEQLHQSAKQVDRTLVKSVATAQRKLLYQLQKTEKKFLMAVARQNSLLINQLRKAENAIYPGGKLQERTLNIFSFHRKLPELIREIYEQIDWKARGHQWITGI